MQTKVSCSRKDYGYVVIRGSSQVRQCSVMVCQLVTPYEMI